MTDKSANFDYDIAFCRNLGFLNTAEQQKLKASRIAIAGLGGTGGAQVHALSRLGIGAFNLADPDIFELANFNRQIGATLHTIGRPKVEVMEELVHSINPDADVRLFRSGINSENVEDFLSDTDLVIDSLDFYCFKERFLLYQQAREHNIWVLTSPPLGFGYTLLIFDPNGMTFEDYFKFNAQMSEQELAALLVAGISPEPYMMHYLNKGGLDLATHQLPSVGAAPFLIAGIISTEVANTLTHKGKIMAVPEIIQFDALLRKFSQNTYR